MLRATISGGTTYGICWPSGTDRNARSQEEFLEYVENFVADRFPKDKYPNLKIEYEGLEPK